MDAVRNDVEKLVEKELESANKKFPMFRSEHEGAAVLFEEIQESEADLDLIKADFTSLWNSVKRNWKNNEILKSIKQYSISLACEAIQVAVMAQKFVDSQKEMENQHE